MAIEAQDMYAKLADVCTLNPRVSFKTLKLHGLFSQEILEFLFYEFGMITIDEAIGIAFDQAEKQKIWRRAAKSLCVNGLYLAADLIKVPQQYYKILQRRDIYMSLDDAITILGVSRRTLYFLLRKLGCRKNFKSEITLDEFKQISQHITGVHIQEITNKLGLKKARVYSLMQEHGIPLANNGYISLDNWELLKSFYAKTRKSCKNNIK